MEFAKPASSLMPYILLGYTYQNNRTIIDVTVMSDDFSYARTRRMITENCKQHEVTGDVPRV